MLVVLESGRIGSVRESGCVRSVRKSVVLLVLERFRSVSSIKEFIRVS